MKKLILLLWGLIVMSGCVEKQAEYIEDPILPKVETYETSLFMVGDALLHTRFVYDNQLKDKSFDFLETFQYIKPYIKQHDLAFYNQETILGGTEFGISGYPRFNSPQEFGDNMIELGFNIVSLANNHTLDRGEKPLQSALEFWGSKDVVTAGSYESYDAQNAINICESNGITYAFLAYTDSTNGIPHIKDKTHYVNIYDEDTVKKDIEKYQDLVDIVIVSIHYGAEYVHQPNKRQVEIAEYLASLDVDIVIGHHPHVVQPITYIDDTLVIYSLGNFISGQVGLEKRIGLMVSVEIEKTVVDKKVESVELKDVEYDLFYNEYKEDFTDYMLYPFKMLNNEILNNYESIYIEYQDIVKNMDNSIKLGID